MTRFAILLTGTCAIGALLLPVLARPAPRLVWNLSASVPVGLYAAHRSAPRHGDLVAAHAPKRIARLMAERGYLPLRVPMLKHVAAAPGQRICRTGTKVSVDGIVVAQARLTDRAGRSLPRWSGCRTLRSGELFLLNPASADSFDGRYFGPVSARSIVAVLKPLWLPGSPSPTPARRESPPPPVSKRNAK